MNCPFKNHYKDQIDQLALRNQPNMHVLTATSVLCINVQRLEFAPKKGFEDFFFQSAIH